MNKTNFAWNGKIKKVFTLLLFAVISLLLTNIAFADLYLNSRTGSIYLNTTDLARLQITSGGNLVLLGQANVSIPGNLSVLGNVSVDGGTLFVDAENNRVGIGTTTPADILTVIGSVSVFGSLNATYINATEILVNGFIVNRSIDLTPYQIISNITKLPFSKFTLENVSNDTISKLNTSILFNWNMSNIARYINDTTNITSYQPISNITKLPFSNFQLANVSNNTLVKGDNTSISLLNIS